MQTTTTCRRKFILLAATLVLPASLSRATDYSWSTATSGTYTETSHWTPSGIPNPADTALINVGLPGVNFYTVSLFPSTPTGSLTVNFDGAELDLRTVNGDTHTAIDSLNIQKGTLYFTNGNGTGLNHVDLGTGGLTLGQVAEADFGDGNSWQVHGNITNNGGNLANTTFGGFHLSGYSTFTGIFNNAGAVTTTSPAYVNNFTGTFANLPNGKLTIQPNFNFRITGGTFDFQGGTVDGTVQMYNGATLKTSAGSVQGNGAVFKFVQPGYLATHLAPGAVVSVPSTLTTTNAATTNFGTIRLENPNGMANLVLDTDGTGFLTNAPAAALVINSYSTLQGHLINRGLTLANTYLNATSITNGNVADDTGVYYQTLGETTISSPAPGVQGNFTQLAGLLHIEPGNANHLVLDNSIFHYDGGTVEGAVQLRNNSVFTGSAADGHNATFQFTGTGILGRVPEHTNILVDGHAVTAVGQDNFGTITLTSTNGGAAVLTATDSVTFPNRGNLDLYFGAYVHGSVYSIGAVHFYGPGTFQNADLYNDYIVDVSPNMPATFLDSTLRQVNGPMTLANGSLLSIDHSTFSFEGGTITRSGTASIHLKNNSTLKTTIPDGNGAVFELDRGNTLATDLSPGVTVNEHDGALTVFDGHTNRGSINLDGPSIAPTLTIFRTDSGTPTGTMANRGTLRFQPGSSPSIYGAVDNYGTITAASLLNSQGQLLGTSWVNFYNGNLTVNPGSTFSIEPYSHVFFHGQGTPGSNTFTLNGGTLSLGKQSHLDMLDGGSFVFLSGTLSLSGATVSMQAPPGGIPLASMLQATGSDASLSIATAAGADLAVSGGLIGNDGASIVAQGGGNIVAQGGGNIVAQGGGNIAVQGGLLISNDGGSIVAQGGGNLVSTITAAGIVSSGAGNISALDGAKIVSSGAGNIISGNGSAIISGNGSAIVASGAGNIISGNGSAIISPDGASAPAGLAAPSAPPASVPLSTVTLDGGSISSTAGNIAIGSDASLTGHGTASATHFYSAGILSPDNGTITINAPATLSGGSLAGTGTLSFAQGLSVTAAVSKSSPGPILLNGPLAISSGASLDLSTALLTLDSSTLLSQLRQYLLSHQLFSSSADANHTLGYVPTGSSTLIQLTLTGDANLDGLLSADDYALLDRGSLTAASTWSTGDFDYDGTVTSADYFLLDSAYGKQQGGTLSPSLLAQRQSQFGDAYVSQLLTSIPEPSSLAACALALLPVSRRRRRPH